MIDARKIADLHDEQTSLWHEDDTPRTAVEGLSGLILRNHRANFDLWHQEDKARDPQASDGEIAGVKRAIDTLNQQRNDVVETIDEMLMKEAPAQAAEVPLHSETPGMMIDRMSILALKIFHTREQAERTEVPEAHRSRNRARLEVLLRQRADLLACLDVLWSEVLGGRRRFAVYRQMKMYNDPELNPAIYRSAAERAG